MYYSLSSEYRKETLSTRFIYNYISIVEKSYHFTVAFSDNMIGGSGEGVK